MLEIGKNSVNPWIIPKTIASTHGMSGNNTCRRFDNSDRSGIIPFAMRTFSKSLAIALFVLLATASTAFAGYDGEGLYGEADDKVVTFFGLGLVVLIPLITVIGSVTQSKLERRKQERNAAATPRSSIRR